MAVPVVTVAAGGLPVVDVTATTPALGVPISEATNSRGVAVTKVASRGVAVVYVVPGAGGGSLLANIDDETTADILDEASAPLLDETG